MDIKNALEAVEAIRATVPEAEQTSFDTELVSRLGLTVETMGAVAINTALEVTTSPIDAKEVVTSQLDTADTSYQTLTEQLNDGRKRKDRVELANPETLSQELEAWFTEDKQVYVARAMEADPELRFTLVATPNITATNDEIMKLARLFGNDQPYKTDIWEAIYNQYTGQELSGTNPNNGNTVKFSLIPNKLNDDLQDTVDEQRHKLRTLQAKDSFLEVPSVLEDVAHWNALRAGGDNLTNGDVVDRTYVRHFDLPKMRVDDWSGVPYSCVSDFGRAILNDSNVVDGDHGRVSVG